MHISPSPYSLIFTYCLKNKQECITRAGGDSHVKVTGMLVVSLKGVHCRFWSQVGCLQWKVTIFDHSGIA